MKRFIAVLLIAVLLLAFSGCANKKAYEEAALLAQSGDLDGAIAAYAELGDYEDSMALMAQYTQERDYLAAVALFDAENYAAAETALLALGSYKDAAGKAAECRKILDERAAYEAAMALFESGEYASARDAFLAMGEYLDSAVYAGKCENELGYTIVYNNKTYSAMPHALGTDESGNVTLTVGISEYLRIDISDTFYLRLLPFKAVIYIDGTQYDYSTTEVNEEGTECTYFFDVAGEPERVTLSATLTEEGVENPVYEIDVATLR